MEEYLGRVTIAPNVLVTIVQKTAASVPGVASLSESMPGVRRFLTPQSAGGGVDIRLVDDQVAVDVYLIAKRNVDLLQVGRQLQREVTRAINEIVGKDVREVNVHIDDVATELPAMLGARKATAG